MAAKYAALIYCIENWIRLGGSSITVEVGNCGVVEIKRDGCVVISLTWNDWKELEIEWPCNSIGRVPPLQGGS